MTRQTSGESQETIPWLPKPEEIHELSPEAARKILTWSFRISQGNVGAQKLIFFAIHNIYPKMQINPQHESAIFESAIAAHESIVFDTHRHTQIPLTPYDNQRQTEENFNIMLSVLTESERILNSDQDPWVSHVAYFIQQQGDPNQYPHQVPAPVPYQNLFELLQERLKILLTKPQDFSIIDCDWVEATATRRGWHFSQQDPEGELKQILEAVVGAHNEHHAKEYEVKL